MPIEKIEDSESKVNDCDGSELWWKCPACGKQHREGDVFEWLGKSMITRSECDGCGKIFSIQVRGDYSFNCYDLGFSEKKDWSEA